MRMRNAEDGGVTQYVSKQLANKSIEEVRMDIEAVNMFRRKE